MLKWKIILPILVVLVGAYILLGRPAPQTEVIPGGELGAEEALTPSPAATKPVSMPKVVSGDIDEVVAALLRETSEESAAFANEESELQLLTSDKKEAGDISTSYDETQL